jgi:hypothetical protein
VRGAAAPGALVAVILAGHALSAPLHAQQAARVRPELRADAAVGHALVVLAGAGLVTDAGFSTRLAATLGGGLATTGGDPRGVLEGTLVARYLLDPMRQSRRGLYAGGGVGGRAQEGAPPRWFLVGLVGIEGRGAGAFTPALELGVGGGVRVGLVLRPTQRGRR